MKISFPILFFFILSSCNLSQNKKELVLKYMKNSIIIDYKGNHEFIKIPFVNIVQQLDEEPVHCIDSIKKTIYIYVPAMGIVKYSLATGKQVEGYQLTMRYHINNRLFKMHLLNGKVIFSSSFYILIFNENLELEMDVRSVIENKIKEGLVLHNYDFEFIGDTLLFKAMFVDRSEFSNNTRYKRIYKDYEFIIGQKGIQCNNCDSSKNVSIVP